jgi:hypothetical protein
MTADWPERRRGRPQSVVLAASQGRCTKLTPAAVRVLPTAVFLPATTVPPPQAPPTPSTAVPLAARRPARTPAAADRAPAQHVPSCWRELDRQRQEVSASRAAAGTCRHQCWESPPNAMWSLISPPNAAPEVAASCCRTSGHCSHAVPHHKGTCSSQSTSTLAGQSAGACAHYDPLQPVARASSSLALEQSCLV